MQRRLICASDEANRRLRDPHFSVNHIPKDGHVSHGSVTLSGTAEPNRAITVFEVGHEADGTEVIANGKGKWSLTLNGLSVGTHVFSASAVSGSETPANTVEIVVKP